jgi:hypothetical protein
MIDWGQQQTTEDYHRSMTLADVKRFCDFKRRKCTRISERFKNLRHDFHHDDESSDSVRWPCVAHKLSTV